MEKRIISRCSVLSRSPSINKQFAENYFGYNFKDSIIIAAGGCCSCISDNNSDGAGGSKYN